MDRNINDLKSQVLRRENKGLEGGGKKMSNSEKVLMPPLGFEPQSVL